MTAGIEDSALSRDEQEMLRLLRLLKASGKWPEFLATLSAHFAERAS